MCVLYKKRVFSVMFFKLSTLSKRLPGILFGLQNYRRAAVLYTSDRKLLTNIAMFPVGWELLSNYQRRVTGSITQVQTITDHVERYTHLGNKTMIYIHPTEKDKKYKRNTLKCVFNQLSIRMMSEDWFSFVYKGKFVFTHFINTNTSCSVGVDRVNRETIGGLFLTSL